MNWIGDHLEMVWAFMEQNWVWIGTNVAGPIFIPLLAQMMALVGAYANGAPDELKTALQPATAYKDGQLIWVDIAMIGAAFAESPNKDGLNAFILALLGFAALLVAVLFGSIAGGSVPYPPQPPRYLRLMWLTIFATCIIVVLTSILRAREVGFVYPATGT